MAAVTEVFLGPNDGSAAEWESLLGRTASRTGAGRACRRRCTPTTSATSAVSPSRNPGCTLLYAGGIGGFYRQDVFLEAVAELSRDEGIRLDLVVPAREVDSLREQLASAGVSPDAAVRVIVEDLTRYLPATRDVVGVVLFDGHYAAHAFPFKTVSMLERGLHVLCFDQMAVADFLRPYGAGLLCDRDPASVVEAVRTYRERPDRLPVEQLLEEESWAARVRQLEALLATG